MLRDLAYELRLGLRGLRRSPGFTLLVAATLGLGLAANTAIFTIVESIFFRPLPVRAPAELVFFSDSDGRRGSGPLPGIRLPVVSYPLYQQLQADGAHLWSGLAAQQSGHTLAVVRRASGEGGELADSAGRAVSANYFDVLGVRAFRGRTFGPDDQTATGADPVAVLSHRFWQRRFDADPSVVGDRLTINGMAFTVIGVAPPSYLGTTIGSATDFWVPITMDAVLSPPKSEGRQWRTRTEQPGQWWISVIGRLRPGVSLAAAETATNVSLQQYLAQHPDLVPRGAAAGANRIALEPGARGVGTMRQMVLTPLALLMGGVGLLLVIVCLDLSHLLLARANRRHREMTIRTALGASRGRLLRQLLVEGLLLGTLGAGVACLLAPWLVEALLAYTRHGGEEGVVLDVSLDGRLVAFTTGLALVTGLLLGLVPALHATRGNVAQALRAGAAGVTTPSRRLASRLLLASQVAFSLVLLVAAGLLAGSLTNLRRADKGFDEEHLLLAQPDLRLVGRDEARAQALAEAMLARVSAIPGVTSASLSAYAVYGGKSWQRSLSHGRGTPPDRQVTMNTNGVTARYFQTTGMRLLRGRGFAGDERAGGPMRVVLNESAARRLFGAEDPLGRMLHEHSRVAKDMEVVGIVRDARTQGVTRPSPPMYYVPLSQQDDLPTGLEVRTAGDPAALAAEVVRVLREVAPEVPLQSVRTMRAQVDRSLGGERILSLLASIFGLSALFLVSLGLYGVIAQWVTQRTQEIGVRMALGATAGGVRWMVLRQAFGLVLAGVAVGIPAALAAAQLMKGALHGIGPAHPPTFAGAGLVMFAVAALAAYLPARRASRVQPMSALRCE